jgi:hypothetical protein
MQASCRSPEYLYRPRRSQSYRDWASTIVRTGLISMTGVPSIASKPCTSSHPSTSTIKTLARCKPIGLGRSGERVANTPVRGFSTSPRGWTLRTERCASWSQVKIQMSCPDWIPWRQSINAGWISKRASGAPSDPCRGASARSLMVECT